MEESQNSQVSEVSQASKKKVKKEKKVVEELENNKSVVEESDKTEDILDEEEEEEDEEEEEEEEEDDDDEDEDCDDRVAIDLSDNPVYRGLCTLLEDDEGNNLLEYVSLLHSELISHNKTMKGIKKDLSRLANAAEKFLER